MPINIQCQIVFPSVTNIPKDAVTNTLHFYTTDISTYDLDNVRDMIIDFYTSNNGGSSSITRHYSNQVGPTAEIRYYNLGDPKPRVPIRVDTFARSASSSNSALPGEVALVLSFQGLKESGANMARRRNRIYLGPFNTNTLATDGRPQGSLIADIRRAAAEMLRASDASFQWNWDVFSPTDDDSHRVVSGWVNNAWDTQRRRGVEATTRNPWDKDNPPG